MPNKTWPTSAEWDEIRHQWIREYLPHVIAYFRCIKGKIGDGSKLDFSNLEKLKAAQSIYLTLDQLQEELTDVLVSTGVFNDDTMRSIKREYLLDQAQRTALCANTLNKSTM